MEIITMIVAAVVAALIIGLSATGNASMLIRIAMIIAGIGAINWGLSLFNNMNLVKIVAAGNSTIENHAYGVIAAFGAISVVGAFIPH